MDGVVEPDGDFAGASGVIVDCEEDREKVLARGARCVSFSSMLGQRCEVEVECCRPQSERERREHTLGEFPRHAGD